MATPISYADFVALGLMIAAVTLALARRDLPKGRDQEKQEGRGAAAPDGTNQKAPRSTVR